MAEKFIEVIGFIFINLIVTLGIVIVLVFALVMLGDIQRSVDCTARLKITTYDTWVYDKEVEFLLTAEEYSVGCAGR